MEVVTQITLELNGLNKHEYVVIKQGDINSRKIMVKLMDNGRVYLLNNQYKAQLFLTKPDGFEVYVDCIISNNYIILELTEQMLTTAGEALGEILIIDKNTSQLLKSATIVFVILPSEFNNSSITSSNEYNVLLKKIIDIENYKKEIGEYITASEDINISDLPSIGDEESIIKTSYTEENIENSNVNIVLKSNTYFNCISEVKEISIDCPDIFDVNFISKIYLKTNTDSKLINLSSVLKFVGDNCKGGELSIKDNTTYLIEFKYASGKILGNVLSYSEETQLKEPDGDDGENGNTSLNDFSGADDLIEVAMSYYRVRDDYLTYGKTNIMTNNGSKTWEEVTTLFNGVYLRHLDCSGAVGLWLRGITYEEVLGSKAKYNAKDLSPRLDKYSWVMSVRRTAAEIYEDLKNLGWILTDEQLHSETEQWALLKKADIIFLGGQDNGRTLGIYHVMVYYGPNSNGENCVIEFSSTNNRYHKNSNGTNSKYNVGCQIIPFKKKNINNIVAVARIQK